MRETDFRIFLLAIVVWGSEGTEPSANSSTL